MVDQHSIHNLRQEAAGNENEGFTIRLIFRALLIIAELLVDIRAALSARAGADTVTSPPAARQLARHK